MRVGGEPTIRRYFGNSRGNERVVTLFAYAGRAGLGLAAGIPSTKPPPEPV